MPQQGCYVYGIVRAGAELGLSGLIGVETGSVFAVTGESAAAVVSLVSLEEFGEEALERNLASPEWLAQKAQRHQSVVAAVADRVGVIPMRLCTIYRDEARVREMLAEHEAEFASALARLEGKQEWGVRVYSDPEVLRGRLVELSEAVRLLESQVAGKPAGSAYFLRKKIEEAARSEMERICDDVVLESFDRLASHCDDGVLCRLLDREVTGLSQDMILSAAYLLTREAVEPFHAELDVLRAEKAALGLTFELSGPWPPYNFVSPTPDDAVADEPTNA